MGEVIGAVLPLAIGVAVSPVPIIATILMLLSPRARMTGLGFLVGWVVGIVVTTTLVVLIASVSDLGSADDPSTVASWIKLGLGVLLLGLAVQQWRARPRAGEEPSMPEWMQATDSLTPLKGTGLGFLLAAVNPKNLAMCVGAGVEIGGSALSTGDIIVVVAIFSVLASSSVAIPVIGYLVAADRMRAPLEDVKQWLVHNSSTVMAVLLLVIGFVMVGKGIGGLG